MNFDFSEEQKMLRAVSRKFLKEHCGPSVVRRVLDGGAPYDQQLWKGISELDWPGTALAERYGGIGYGYLELCVLAEELGRVVAPIPFSSSVYLAAEALRIAGNEQQRQEYLPRMAAGEVIGSFALTEVNGTAARSEVKTHLRGGRLYGTKIPVPDGCSADLLIVAARPSATSDELKLYIARPSEGGIERETIQTIDPTRPHARLTFDGAAAELLGSGESHERVLENLKDRCAVLLAFEQLGGADAALEMATEYAKSRYAFGRPIGSYQAIKHKLADAFIRNELARSNCYFAAWALSSDAAELPVAAASARIAATEAFEYIAAENIQTHGGIGFTWESDCQMFYRRSKLLALTLGALRTWKHRLIDQLDCRASVKTELAGVN